MFVTYSPKGGEPQKFTFYARDVRVSEQERIERASKMTFAEWTRQIQAGSATARRVLLWVLINREHPNKVRIDDVDFSHRELTVENAREEIEAMIDEVRTKGDLTSPDDRSYLAQLEREAAAAESDPELQGVEGKARLPIVD